MSDDKSDFFHCPAYKLMIADIKSAVPKSPPQNHKFEGEPEEIEYDWYLEVNSLVTKNGQLSIKSVNPSNPCLKLHLKLVWIQGTVIRIDKTDTGNLSLVIIDDDEKKATEEAEATIYEYNTVPGGDHPGIKPGAYVGTLGQVWSNNPVMLKATKIMYLSDKPVCKTAWRDEVTLSRAFLAGLISPST